MCLELIGWDILAFLAKSIGKAAASNAYFYISEAKKKGEKEMIKK